MFLFSVAIKITTVCSQGLQETHDQPRKEGAEVQSLRGQRLVLINEAMSLTSCQKIRFFIGSTPKNNQIFQIWLLRSIVLKYYPEDARSVNFTLGNKILKLASAFISILFFFLMVILRSSVWSSEGW